MVDEILIFEDDKANLNHLVGAADQTKELFFKLKFKNNNKIRYDKSAPQIN